MYANTRDVVLLFCVPARAVDVCCAVTGRFIPRNTSCSIVSRIQSATNCPTEPSSRLFLPVVSSLTTTASTHRWLVPHWHPSLRTYTVIFQVPTKPFRGVCVRLSLCHDYNSSCGAPTPSDAYYIVADGVTSRCLDTPPADVTGGSLVEPRIVYRLFNPLGTPEGK